MWLGWTRKCHLDYILPFFLSERTIHPSRWQKGRLWRAITGRYYAALHNLIPPRAPPDHKYIPLAIDCYLSPIFYRGNYRVPLARGNRRCARRAAYKGAMSDIRVKVNDSCGKRRFNAKMTPLEGEGMYSRVAWIQHSPPVYSSTPLYCCRNIYVSVVA